MSTGRVIWLVWCLAWAGFWFFVGIGTLGLGFIPMAGSVAMFFLPVGKGPRPLPPGGGTYPYLPPPPPELGGRSSVYDRR
jgi:hypothetical protein